MRFLLDTNVVSELFRTRANQNVLKWFQSVASADLYLSVITLGEIRKGVELKRATSGEQAALLEAWLQSLALRYRSRILPLDEEVADVWGRIMASHVGLPVEDSQLAATALHHGLTLVTRNVRHVARTGVAHLDPFRG
ncbi:MAG TPA: type II toxin-antitoxin system VapC family toxin [Stellaceae bacterium]|nr:type II toxin-antitoxin system VapC family toxin [Stellaceae bacterium]